MAALDTLFFDLKLNDLTDEQMKTIKSRLEKQLGLNLDLGKQIEQSVNKGGGVKVKVGANTEALESSLKRISELASKGGMSKTEISELNAIAKSIKEINSEIEKGSASDSKAKEKEISNARLLEQEYIRLSNAEMSMRNIANGSPTNTRFKDAISQLQILMFYLKEARGDAEKTNSVLNGSASKVNVNSALRESLAAARELQKSRADDIKKIESENAAMVRLRATIESMELAMRRYEAVSNAMGKPKSIEAAIQKMREYIELARQASANGKDSLAFMRTNQLSMGAGNLEKAVSTEMALERQRQKAMAASQAQERLAASHYKASIATDSHARASFRLGNSLTGLISITGDLRNQVGMLISAYTFEHILKNVVEIGGEFEKQKMAMGSMLGSLEQADDIFNRMKNLALTSPFNFKDLSNYSRQLTAFGTPYKDLYDTTNRLADISAGLGGDMSRLVLAFSQVKAAAYLRGQEMRQFTEFGVSLPDLLAKKYSEAEHRIVTAGDVIERVSKRMVSFNDVKDVLWKSTDKGGQFYGMQDVLAQSTSGMASNLKDAIDTMYYDIANSNSGMIKESIKGITELVSHWREFSSILVSGLGVYSMYRISMAANNRLIGINTAQTINGVKAAKAEEASILRRRSLYGELTAEQKMLVATSNEITFSDIKMLAASNAINSESLIRLVNTRKITAAQALQVASDLKLTEGEMQYLNSLNAVDLKLATSTGMWSRFTLSTTKSFMMLRSNLSMIGSGISSTLSSIFTKANVAMAVAFIGMDAWFDYQQKIEKIEETNNNTIKNAEDGAKNLSEFLSTNSIDKAIGNNNKKEIEDLIDSYKNELTSQPLDMSGFITNVDTITDATEKLKMLRSEMEALKSANESIAKNGNGFSQSQKADTSWVPDWISSIMGYTVNLGAYIGKAFNIPDEWVQSVRNYGKRFYENGKSIEGIISDVQSSLYDLQTEMSKLNNKDIEEGIDRLHEKYPQLAKDIITMRDAGASNNEVIMAMLNIARDKKITLFPDINKNTFDDYQNNVKVMMDRMDYYVKDGINRVNQGMSNFDVSHHTEKWKLAVLKSAREQATALGLQGKDLEAWNFKVETAISKLTFKIQDHPQAWQNMYDGIKEILAKNGVDIVNSTQKQVRDAFEKYKTETMKTKPFLSSWLNSLNAYTANHPVYIWTQMKSISSQKGTILQGRGKEIGSSFYMDSKYHNGLSNIKTDKDAADYVKSRYDAYQQDLKDAKANRKSTAEIIKGWKEFYNDWNGFVDMDFIINGEKEKKPKKQKVDKTDEYLKTIQNSFSRLKEVKELFNKFLSDDYGESKSLDAVRKSGMSYASVLDKDIKTKGQFDEEYINQLNILIHRLSSNKSKLTKERIKELDDLRKERSEVAGSIQKEEFEKQVEDVKSEMDRLSTLWDRYKKLTDAGMSRKDSSMLIFGKDKSMETSIEDRVSNFYEVLRNRGFRKDINFTMSESEATEAFGGKDNPNYKMFFEIWKQLKSDIENDKLQIQLDGQKAISQIQGIADKIKSTISVALNRSIGINSNTGKQSQLSDYAETGDNGLLKLKDGAEKLLSGRELEMVNSYIEEANQEITKLSSSLLELLPAWDDIFGKAAYKSLSDLLRGMREAKEIISNAKVVNDKNGKPSYFTSSYKDRDGKEQSVSGNIGELDSLKNQTDTRQGDINKKNPFVGMYQSANSYFGAKQQEKKWSDLSKQAEKNGGTTTYKDDKGKKQTITKKDADSKSNDASEQASKASLSFAEALQNSVGKLQTWNNGLSMLGSTIEALGGGSDVSNAAGVAGGMLNGAQSMSGLGPWGMAAGAAMGLISGIASMHDKKLDRAIERSKEKVQELELSYKQIEDSLKYNLGNAAEGYFMNTDEVNRVKEAQSTINSIRSKQKLAPFDLMKLQSASNVLKECWATVKYLDENDKENYGNAYNYQRNLYQQQLEQLKQQKADEEGKKKSDQSKINDYNSQIEEMENKITTFSMDLANSLYGIDVKGWADQLGDAIYEAWMKGMSGEEAFEKKSNEIISNLVKSWFKINVVEKAFQNLKNDLFGTDGTSGIFGSDNNISESDINNIASDIMSAQNDVTKSTNKLQEIYERLKARGIDIKNTTDSSSSNVLSGVTEQEANIIAAYLDAIRQDMYNNRTNLQAIIDRGLKMQESPMMQSQLNQLIQIQSNTYKNMELVGEIKSILNDVTLGNKKIYIN